MREEEVACYARQKKAALYMHPDGRFLLRRSDGTCRWVRAANGTVIAISIADINRALEPSDDAYSWDRVYFRRRLLKIPTRNFRAWLRERLGFLRPRAAD